VYVPALPDPDWFAGTLGAEPFAVEGDSLDRLLRTLADGPAGDAGRITDEGYDERREAAAVSIGRFGQDAVAPLAGLLAGGDAGVRWWAARALAEVGVPGAAGPLAGALSDPDADVRACAALALGRLGSIAAARSLVACLADESDFVASVAADALSMTGEVAVPVLAEMLARGRPRARLLAVRALSRIGSPQAIGPLFEVVEDPNYLVSYYAREALDALGVGLVFVSP
jgi:HEAT repeat protein